MAALHLGTSGWSYSHWHGPFYPGGLPHGGELAYYASRFRAVEVNTTFYHLPSVETVRNWVSTAGDDFLFACKASRYVTHMKKLKDPEQSTERLFEVLRAFGPTLGPVLFQLPPRWALNLERLAAFLRALPAGYRYAFEFRDPSWIAPPVFDLLRGANAAFCIYDLAGFTAPSTVTADFVYLRLHGPDGAYQGSYSDEALQAMARSIRDWRGQGLDVYGFFDNDQEAFAARDATRLRGFCGE